MGQQTVTPPKSRKQAQQEQPGIIPGEQNEQPPQVAPVSMSMKLDEQGRHMSPHVVVHLSFQSIHAFSMMMVDHGGGVVPACAARSQDAVPELRVLAAARGPGPQPFIKMPHFHKNFPAKSHVGPGPPSPRRGIPSF